MELERHIEILLLSNDCVIVPGFGGFTASHVPARFDGNDNMFIPPVRTLGFNPKLGVNDSLLAQSYTEAYDISYPEALKRIASETNELKQHIENDGSYTMNDIGTLYLTESGSIGFTPCEAGLLTPALYSLSSFEMKKLDEATAGTQQTETEVAPQAVRPNIAALKVETMPLRPTVKETAETEESNERTIRIKLSVLRNVAAVLVAVVGFFLLSNPVNNSNSPIQISQMEYGVVSKLINSNAAKSSTVHETRLNTKASNYNTAINSVRAESKTMAATAVNKKSDYYCIVLASQVTLPGAKTFAARLADKGYAEARALTEKGRSTKVVYGRYNTQSEAYNALNKLNGDDTFADAWVYKVKN